MFDLGEKEFNYLEKRESIDVLCKTYNDDSAGDGDCCQHAMGDGVRLEGIHDALIVTVHTPLIWLVHNGHNDEGQRRCGEITERVRSEIE